MKFYTESQRIYLRKVIPGDASLLLELDSDPEVMKYLTDGRASSIEDIKAILERVIQIFDDSEGRFGLWPAFLKSNNEFIGWFIFRPDKNDPLNFKRIELGYRLKKAFWGKGYATEMSLVLIKKGFYEFGIDEIFATAMLENIGSQAVMKKVGMTFLKNYIEPIFPGTDKRAVHYRIMNPGPAN